MLLDRIDATAQAIKKDVQDTTRLPGGVHNNFILAFGAMDAQEENDRGLVVSSVTETFRLSHCKVVTVDLIVV